MAGFRLHPDVYENVRRALAGEDALAGRIFGVGPDWGWGVQFTPFSRRAASEAAQPAHGVRAYVPTQGMLDELTACRWGHPDPDLMDHVMCRRRGLIDDEAHLTARGRAVLDQTTGRRRARG